MLPLPSFLFFLERSAVADCVALTTLPAKGLVPDPDDTASTLSVLQLLGVTCSPDGLLKSFQGKDHFFTYPKERNPSLSVNGNVLMTLLRLSNPGTDYSSAIEKCIQFLCRRWWEADGLLDDKWVSISPRVA